MVGNPCRGTAAFVMPHYGDTTRSREYLRIAVESILAQSDPDWHLFVVDDCSPQREDRLAFENLQDDRITVIQNEHREGPGPTRNKGIEEAVRLEAPFVLFLDSDDVASSDRLSLTREVFLSRQDVGVVYTRFAAIDKDGHLLDPALLTPSIKIILDTLSATPPVGPDAWIEMATTYGYCNLTSTTAVRTEVAAAVPFPAEMVSDDLHTWFRYGGYGAAFYCIPASTCGYRIPDPQVGSSCRRRYGEGFYQEKARVDAEGLEQAIEMAVAGGRLAEENVNGIRDAFRRRLAQEMMAEGLVWRTRT